jgi:hypothetical protein
VLKRIQALPDNDRDGSFEFGVFWEYLWRYIFGGPAIAPELEALAGDLPTKHLVMVENPWLEAHPLPQGVLLRNQSCYWKNATRGG